jgi:SAM-dependent methyltransferase
VQSFYSAVANVPAQEIANPVHYDEQEIVHIPEESRIRSYGCGSPVLDCELKPGETLVDLGCGAGVECFIAAKKVGPEGRVIGIDMADAMLALAEKSKQRVTAHLAYDTIEFKKAYLEQLPLMSNTVDVVISNCVINLSPDKRTTFAEISRILKPGGRMVISDIVYDEDIPLAIKYNEKLRGECIGGAFKESELFALLGDLNFEAATVKKRVFYREVKGHRFYSITYTAMKPQGAARKELIYRGPFAALITDEGTVLRRGVKTGVALSAGFHLDESVFAVTRKGEVENVAQEVTCECSARSTHLTRKSPRVKNPAGR